MAATNLPNSRTRAWQSPMSNQTGMMPPRQNMMVQSQYDNLRNQPIAQSQAPSASHVVNPNMAGYEVNYGPDSMGPAIPQTMAPYQEQVGQTMQPEMQPLEGEFIPSQMAETQFDMYAPEGNYGLAGAEDAIQQGLAGQVGAYTEGAYNAANAANTGYEQGRYDIGRGMQESIGSIRGGVDQSRNDLSSGFGTSMDLLTSGVNRARGDIDSYLQSGMQDLRSGTGAATGAISGQLNQGIDSLRSGISTGRGDINSATGRAVSRFDPYSQTGQSALDVEAARSGALGPEAQAEAFANYQESPGQEWNRLQQERSLVRNAAATGGTQSGNVLTALQKQASGIASQNYQQDLMNLRSLSERGQQAAGSQAGFESQAGRDLAQMEMAGGQSILNARTQAGTAMGNIRSQAANAAMNAQLQAGTNMGNMAYGAGQAGAGFAQDASRSMADLSAQEGYNVANLTSQAGNNLAQMAQQAGMTEAQYMSALGNNMGNAYGQAGTNISTLRSQAGRDIASQIDSSGRNLSNLQSGLGTNFANMDQQTAQLLAQLSQNQGTQTSGLRTQLAAMLSNLATGNASNQQNYALAGGNAAASGVTNPWGNTAGTLAGVAASVIPALASSGASTTTPAAGNTAAGYTGADFNNWAGQQ